MITERLRLLAAVAGALALGACADGSTPAEKGRQVYQAYCVSCHGSDPARAGPIGPAIKGSSRALLEARVLRGGYPPGYKPRRPTQIMQPIPQLAPDIPDLAVYLE